MRYFLSIGMVLLLFVGCQPKQDFTAQNIVDKAIAASQTDKLANANLSFIFRDRTYFATRQQGAFSLQRELQVDSQTTTDVLSNEGFQRFINDKLIELPDSMALKYSESVNSVHYFSVLPFGLNDAAVNKKRLEDVTIKGKEYYKIEVTFDQQGGGVDFEDVFVYWIGKESLQIDYLAYLFHVNGGGVRFREVRKEHNIQGIRLADYNNYKPNEASIDVRDTDKAFKNGGLTKVSEVNLENIEIQLMN